MAGKPNHPKKTLPGEKPLTLGELIAATYDACGDQVAGKILRLAAESRIIRFKRRQTFID